MVEIITTNGVPEREIWDGLRRESGWLVRHNAAAAALAEALRRAPGFDARVLEKRLALDEAEVPQRVRAEV